MDGIGWFTAETLRRIVLAHPEHDFYFFFDRKWDDSFVFSSNVHPISLCPQARHPVLWYLFFEKSIPRMLKKYKIDLFLSPECYIPLHAKIPVLSVVHDINFEHAKDFLKPSHQVYMNYFASKFASRSTRIATVSGFSKQDISEVYRIDPQKIDVVYDGVNENYRPISAVEQDEVRCQYSHGCKYFIFIGTILKRKNLSTLLLAFDKYKKYMDDDTKLMVVGNRVWWQDELKEAYDNMNHQCDVIFTGRTPQEELFKLLGSALALVYPSTFEGFGIPILEAFKAEIPVVTSNCTSMPEVAGDAALLVDPNDADMMSKAMVEIVKDDKLRKELVAKGKLQGSKFSWDITAEKLWDSMMKTMEEGR